MSHAKVFSNNYSLTLHYHNKILIVTVYYIYATAAVTAAARVICSQYMFKKVGVKMSKIISLKMTLELP